MLYMVQISLVLLFTAAFSSVAQAQSLDACQAQYRNRASANPEASASALDCFRNLANQALSAGNAELYRTASEGYFLSVSFLVTHSRTNQTRRVTDAFNAADRFVTEMERLDPSGEPSDTQANPWPSGAAYYWRAAFRNWKSNVEDGLTILFNEEPVVDIANIPWRTIRGLGNVRSDARKAMQRDPRYHGYGAARILGLTHFRTPPGPLEARPMAPAVNYLSRAYRGDSNFSLNIVFYARALHGFVDENGAPDPDKRHQALRILRSFIARASSNPAGFGADREPETRDDLDRARYWLAEFERQ